MDGTSKALAAVLICGLPAFFLARQVTSSFISDSDFATWRNAWIAATVGAFLCSSFFAYIPIILAICLYKRNANGTAAARFFVLLFAAPLADVLVEGIGGIRYLFPLNNGRVLAIALLLPLLFTGRRVTPRLANSYTLPDRLVLSYVLLLVALAISRVDLTNALRIAIERILDILVPYLAFSRAVLKLSDIRKVLAGYIAAVLPLSFIALVESAKTWRLYAPIFYNWGAPLTYDRREGALRAAASAGGGITLGLVLMVGIGCLLAFRPPNMPWRKYEIAALTALGVGLILTFSRGPWLGTIFFIIVYVMTGPRPGVRLAKMIAISVIVIAPLLWTPIGDKIAHLLPFIGSADAQTITYREQLWQNGLIVVERNLWFGSSDYLSTPEMQALIQGEGIIDTVNSYLGIALDSGLIGLALFLGFFATTLLGLRRIQKLKFVAERDYISNCARSAFATLLAILATIATTSSIDFVPYIYWSFAGLCVALIRIAITQPSSAVGGVKPDDQLLSFGITPDGMSNELALRRVDGDKF